jgi:hypothetical protein
MATAVHVNGAAVIQVAAAGEASVDALNTVGITENGPQISIDFHKEGVMADNGGPNIPVEWQRMGKTAKITFALPIYDIAVVTTWFLGNQAGATEGSLPQLGSLMLASGGGFRLTISSPIDAVPWRFFNCSIDSISLRPGTKYNIYDVSIDAIPYIYNNAVATDKKLYDHTVA